MTDTKISGAAVEVAADLLHGMESASTMGVAREVASLIIAAVLPHLHLPPAELVEQQGVGELHAELLAHAENLERMAAGDRETGESIEQAVETGEGYTPDDAVDVAAGLQHAANSAEETATILRKAASTLAATGRQQVGEVQGDTEMRSEWIAAGGRIHGPNVETVTMPESDYFRFRAALTARPAQQESKYE